MSDPKPMRGSAPDPKFPITFPKAASIKYDGIRVFMDRGEPKTRSLKTIPNLHVAAQLRRLRQDVGYDLDLELIVGDPADPLCYNKTYRAVMTVEGEPEVDFYVFDIVREDSGFAYRQAMLKIAVESLRRWPNVKLVEQVTVESQEQLDALYAKVTSQGHEGLILRSLHGYYKYGKATAKSQDLLKLKPEEDSEFAIEGAYEAMENTNEAFTNELGRTARSSHQEGKVPLGMLGGFHARDLYTGVQFDCAPGKLDHDARRQLWQEWLANPEGFKKMIGKYRHFPVGVVEKPRHPRWIGWRSIDDMDTEKGNHHE